MASGSINVTVKVRWPYLWYAVQWLGLKRLADWLCIRCEIERG